MNDSQRRVSDALDALTAAVEDATLPVGVVWSLGYLRAWMEDRIVSERTTGATDSQIEAAHEALSAAWADGTIKQHKVGENVDVVAAALVPPGYAIVPASAAPTEEQRAAVGRIVAAWALRDEMYSASTPDQAFAANMAFMLAERDIKDGDIEAARAVAEGGNCQTCKGSGVVPTGVEYAGQEQVGGCPECEGGINER